jgi:branched-chain amino acid transport system permease protein
MLSALRPALYIAIVGALLALSGIFVSFAERDLVEGVFGLNGALVAALAGGAGLLTVLRAYGTAGMRLVMSALAGLVVALPLVLLALIESVIDLRFVFANLTQPIADTITFGQAPLVGVVLFCLFCVGMGLAGGAVALATARTRRIVLTSLITTLLISLLADQVDNVLAPADGLAIGVAVLLGYFVSEPLGGRNFWMRLLVGAAHGALVGVVAGLIVNGGGLADGGILRMGDTQPVLLALAPDNALLVLATVFAGFGLLGAVLRCVPYIIATITYYGAAAVLVLAFLGLRTGLDLFDELIILALTLIAFSLLPRAIRASASRFQALQAIQQRVVRVVIYATLVGILIIAPSFLGQYITNVLNLVGIYIIMGIGLNIVVGNAGLLDLGYVAFFAIGAYTVGILTAPSILTCGGIAPSEIATASIDTICSGRLDFWEAWLVAIAMSAVGGVLLGTPVLGLRGDYLAIVTLGFGEIIRILLRFDDFRPLFGAAQGIANIPRPTIDLSLINRDWRFEFATETSMYYLIIVAILIVIFVAARLSNSRIGRAWRAMRADEDVARASGIHLTRAKLLAFALGAAFAGIGGALSATRLYGAYPDSFTLQVSINVLSLVIIGGMGSIPGVIVGALMLVGLPEVLRELADYRLLAFGVLLVATMLLRPQGLLPAVPRSASEGGS